MLNTSQTQLLDSYPIVSPALPSLADELSTLPQNIREFWVRLCDVLAQPSHESPVDLLVFTLFKLSGLSDDLNYLVSLNQSLPVFTGGQRHFANIDVCVKSISKSMVNHCFLLVHEDKSTESKEDDPIAQVRLLFLFFAYSYLY